MAQTGYTPIQLYYSSTTTNAPTAGNLASGELAINITDGKLFYKDNGGVVQVIAWKTTPTTAGGTGLTSWTAGDLPYYATGTTLSKLGIGTNGQILTSTGTAPQWSTLSGVAVTTFSAGTTGFTPSVATSGAITLAGTLATTNGGTGLTSFTANRVFYSSSTSAIGSSANLTFDGTTLTANALTTTSTVTINGGTANGVAYLNGSKVLTTGSALVFDGTNLSSTGGATFQGSPTGFSGGEVRLGPTTANLQNAISTQSTGTPELFFDHRGTGNLGMFVWRIGTGGSNELARLTSTGLGIGTSSPGERLDVVGTARVIRSTGATNTGDQNTVVVGATTTGAYASSYGAGLQFQVTNSGGGYSGGRIVSRLGADNFTANLVFQARNYGYADSMTLDANGNLLLGQTSQDAKFNLNGPSTSTSNPQIRIRNSADGSGNSHLDIGYYYQSGVGEYGFIQSFTDYGSAPRDLLLQPRGGNVGIGTTSPSQLLDVSKSQNTDTLIRVTNANTGGSAAAQFFASNGTTQTQFYHLGTSYTTSGVLEASQGGVYNATSAGVALIAANASGILRFATGGTTERARITSGGYFKASNTGSYLGSTAAYHEFVSNNGDSNVLVLTNSNATLPYGLSLYFSGGAPNDATRTFLQAVDTGATRATIRSNGGIANFQANDANLSDRREKTNFSPAKNYLDTICAIPVQTFNYIDQSEDDPGLTLGVVAQDVQAVAPELVMESNWGTEDNPKMRLSIYQTDLQYALMKCIQELKAQNDDLRARVAQLEGASA